MKRIVFLILCAACAVFVNARTWDKDMLGDDFEKVTIDMADDYSGKVVSTIIRKKHPDNNDKAVLYVHGYNDYYFQKELADKFIEHGYNFYAVDLRKYGRSIMPGQTKFEVRDMCEYFADIDSVFSIIKEDSIKGGVVLMGHSTGGLTSSYYMVKGGEQKKMVSALVLNSPFMDMNLSYFLENIALPVVTTLGGLFPDISIPKGSSDAYAQSLLENCHGEWEFDTDWKIPFSPNVTMGWLRAIDDAQSVLQKGVNIDVPILLMRSDKSVYGDVWTPEFNKGDAVLNVDEISKFGRQLGSKVQELVVKDGLHDLVLSRKPVRDATYLYIFNWLEKSGM